MKKSSSPFLYLYNNSKLFSSSFNSIFLVSLNQLVFVFNEPNGEWDFVACNTDEYYKFHLFLIYNKLSASIEACVPVRVWATQRVWYMDLYGCLMCCVALRIYRFVYQIDWCLLCSRHACASSDAHRLIHQKRKERMNVSVYRIVAASKRNDMCVHATDIVETSMRICRECEW